MGSKTGFILALMMGITSLRADDLPSRCTRIVLQAAGASSPHKEFSGISLERFTQASSSDARILVGSAAIPNLPDGAYVFVMDLDQNIAVAPRNYGKGQLRRSMNQAIRKLADTFDPDTSFNDFMQITFAGTFRTVGRFVTDFDFDVLGFEPDDYGHGLDLIAIDRLKEVGLVTPEQTQSIPNINLPRSDNAHSVWAAVFKSMASDTAPSVLRRSSLQRRPREIISAGRLVNGVDSFHDLEDGVYVFLVARDFQGKNLQGIFSYRTPVRSPRERILVTHRSLLQKLLDINEGKPVEVISAGEFEVRMNQAIRWGNKAGSFPIENSISNLYVGISHFANNGLSIPDRAMISDASKNVYQSALGPPHLKEEHQAIIRIRLESTKELRARRQTLLDLRNVLALIAPHRIYAAQLDSAFIDSIREQADTYRGLLSRIEKEKSSFTKAEHRNAVLQSRELHLAYLLVEYLEKEGPEFVLARLFKRYPFSTYLDGSQARIIRRMLKVIEPIARAEAIKRGTLEHFLKFPKLKRHTGPIEQDPDLTQDLPPR